MGIRNLAAALAAAEAGGAGGSGAVELSLMSGGAVKSGLNPALDGWRAASGHAARVSFAPAGELKRRISEGEGADILVMPRENIEAYEREGVVVPGSRRDLGAVGMGVAVRQGAPLPDVSTPEALRATLLAAKSVTYMDPERGTSGRHFDTQVLPRLGIRDEVRAKAVLGEGGFIAEKVARGEVEMAFHQMTEMLPVAGIAIVGPLPAPLQKDTVYAGAVMRAARHPREAQALLDYLAGAGRKAFLERGFSVPS